MFISEEINVIADVCPGHQRCFQKMHLMCIPSLVGFLFFLPEMVSYDRIGKCPYEMTTLGLELLTTVRLSFSHLKWREHLVGDLQTARCVPHSYTVSSWKCSILALVVLFVSKKKPNTQRRLGSLESESGNQGSVGLVLKLDANTAAVPAIDAKYTNVEVISTKKQLVGRQGRWRSWYSLSVGVLKFV